MWATGKGFFFAKDGPLAERRSVFFGYCPRNKFVFLQPSAGGSSPVPASTCRPCNLRLLSISDMTSNLQECRMQREVSINDWSAQGGPPAFPSCESRGVKKNFTYTARWSLGIEIVALNPRLLCSNLGLRLSDRAWSASGHPVAVLQSGYWPSVESENGEPWLKHQFLIHRSIRDQCVQVGDLAVVITGRQEPIRRSSLRWGLISVSENADTVLDFFFLSIDKYAMGNEQLVCFKTRSVQGM